MSAFCDEVKPFICHFNEVFHVECCVRGIFVDAYTISADADFRCQTVCIRKPSQLILLPILYTAQVAIEIFAEISFGLFHIAIRFV